MIFRPFECVLFASCAAGINIGCSSSPSDGAGAAGASTSSTVAAGTGSTGTGGQSVGGSSGVSSAGGSGRVVVGSGTGGSSGAGGSAGATGNTDAGDPTDASVAVPLWACHGAGMALQFDGDQVDEVIADLMGDMPGGLASRTIEMWAFTNPKTWRMGHPLFDVGTMGGGKVLGLDFATKWENSVLVQDAYPSLNIYSDKTNDYGWWAPFTPGSPNYKETGWVHVAIRYDKDTNEYALLTNAVTIFGGQATLHGHPALRTEPTPLHIGFSLDFGDKGFDGKIDEVRIWNRSRTNAEIAGAMHTVLRGDESGLVGYWHFDEGVGTVSTDFSKGHHDAVMISPIKPIWVKSEGLELTCP